MKQRATSRDGVLVVGRVLSGRAGQRVVVTLERACTWRGTLVPMRFEAAMDADGRFDLRLPPSEELQARDGAPPPQYQFQAENVGAFLFSVPAVGMWRLE